MEKDLDGKVSIVTVVISPAWEAPQLCYLQSRGKSGDLRA